MHRARPSSNYSFLRGICSDRDVFDNGHIGSNSHGRTCVDALTSFLIGTGFVLLRLRVWFCLLLTDPFALTISLRIYRCPTSPKPSSQRHCSSFLASVSSPPLQLIRQIHTLRMLTSRTPNGLIAHSPSQSPSAPAVSIHGQKGLFSMRITFHCNS